VWIATCSSMIVSALFLLMEWRLANPFVAAFITGIALCFFQCSVCVSLVCTIKPHLLGTAVALLNATESLLLVAALPLSGLMLDYVTSGNDQEPDTDVVSYFGPMNLFGALALLSMVFSALAMVVDLACRRRQLMHLLMNPSSSTIEKCLKDLISWGQYHIEMPLADVLQNQTGGLADLIKQLFYSLRTATVSGLGNLQDGGRSVQPTLDLEREALAPQAPPSKEVEMTSATMLDLLFIRCGLVPASILTR